MVITHLSTYDIQGGAARAAWRLHHQLRRSGHTSSMLTRHKTSADRDVHQVELETGDNVSTTLNHWSQLQKGYVDENRTGLTNCFFSLPVPGFDIALHPLVQAADIIHLHWVSGFISPQAIGRLQQLGKPIVWTLHDHRAFTGGCHFSFGCRKYETDCLGCPQLGDKAPRLSDGVLAQALDAIDPARITVATPSRWMAACACGSSLFRHSRINVIPNGVDTFVFRPMARAEARAQLGFGSKGIYFLFGTDSIRDQRKGMHILLEALALCRNNNIFQEALASKKVNFFSYGWGSNEDSYDGFPVHGFGHIEHEEKMALLYAAADAYICPTLEDNLPNTIMEALSCGTPVLASNVGGVPDMVTSHRNGLLFKPNDPASTAAAITGVVENTTVLRDWSSAARQGIESQFTLALQAKRFSELYTDLLQHRSVPVPSLPESVENMPLLPASWEIPGPLLGNSV